MRAPSQVQSYRNQRPTARPDTVDRRDRPRHHHHNHHHNHHHDHHKQRETHLDKEFKYIIIALAFPNMI